MSSTGNLHDDDVVDHSDEELWVKEPYRDKRLIVHTAKPFNAEIPPQYQAAHFDTPKYVPRHSYKMYSYILQVCNFSRLFFRHGSLDSLVFPGTNYSKAVDSEYTKVGAARMRGGNCPV